MTNQAEAALRVAIRAPISEEDAAVADAPTEDPA